MEAVSHVSLLSNHRPQRNCPNCGFLAWCLPAKLELRDSKRLNDLVTHQRSIKLEGYVYGAGSKLESLNVVCSGFLKTSLTDANGRNQVTGFSMAGDLVGMDAIGTGKHICDTVALEDSTVCGMRYADFEELGHTVLALQHHFHQIMSAEIARDHGIMLLLGSMRAEERVAVFLLNLSKRYSVRGYSETHFRLPMTRQDIGSHLGLKLETVSRAFSRFKDSGIIAIQNKEIEIRSLAKLQQIIGDRETRRAPPPLQKFEEH